jgi:Ras-related protein Rab-1A
VAPSASDNAKIRTKKEFLIRSFKDGRYYTVSKKDTRKFKISESPIKKTENPTLRDTMERAITFMETRELPPHWDRDILFNHGIEPESTNNSTTASSESDELDEDEDDEEEESPEEKDHLVAELYKHMEDRGSPIDKTPHIEGKDVDLYKLYRIVDKLGGHVRVSNKKLWRQVATKLGFFSTWGINQVRVHYNRYLRSFEELNRTLGCTMVSNPKPSAVTALSSARNRQVSGSSRVQMRGTSRAANKTTGDQSDPSGAGEGQQGRDEEEMEALDVSKGSPAGAFSKGSPAGAFSKGSPAGSSEAGSTKTAKGGGSSAATSENESPGKKTKKAKKAAAAAAAAAAMESAAAAVTAAESARKKATDEMKMTTRPRRDSSSSLAAAIKVKAEKDSIGETTPSSSPSSAPKKPFVRMDRNKETENEAKKLTATSPPKTTTTTKRSSAVAASGETNQTII